MAVGRANGIRPADVVGSIANEANIPGREIGPIDIQEDVTYVGIPERYVDVVLDKVGKASSARPEPVDLPGGQVARPRAVRHAKRPRRRPPRKYDRDAEAGHPSVRSPVGLGASAPRSYEKPRPSEGSGPRSYDSRRPRARRAAPHASPAPTTTTIRGGVRPPATKSPLPQGRSSFLRQATSGSGSGRTYDKPRSAAGPRSYDKPRPEPPTGPRDRVTRATGSGPRDRAPRRDDSLPGREYSPRTPKPFYSDVKKGGFKGKKRK